MCLFRRLLDGNRKRFRIRIGESTVHVRSGNYGMSAFYKSIDTILWGRKTYDIARDLQKRRGRVGLRYKS